MKLFLVVDYQKDFVDGSLGFEEAVALDKRIAKRISECRSEGIDIAFTMDTHYEDYMSTQEGRKLPVPHCIEGTDGHKLYGETGKSIMMSDMVFLKNTFPSLELGEYLKQKEYTEVEICGLVSSICVISNAVIVKAALPQAEIVIDAALTAGFDKKLHEEALDVMEGLQMTVINREVKCDE